MLQMIINLVMKILLVSENFNLSIKAVNDLITKAKEIDPELNN